MFQAKLDHVAIACLDPEKLKRVLAIIGCEDKGTEVVPTQEVVTHFLKPEYNEKQQVTLLELLVPTTKDSVIAKFLDKKGPGFHHISFQVKNLEKLMALLLKNNVRLVYEKQQEGAHSTRVNFIHPESTGGILIEISEKIS